MSLKAFNAACQRRIFEKSQDFVDASQTCLLSLKIMIPKLSVFPITTEVNRQGHLTIGGVDALDLVEKYGTPLYVFDEATVRAKCRDFKREFTRRFPDTTVVYAGKAFLHGSLAGVLKEEGLGLDVVSGGELYIAEAAGFPFDSIYFHGNNKSQDELRTALKRKVGRIVVDNMDELRMLTGLAEESGHIPEILLRIMPGIDAHTHGHLTTGAPGSKFGIPLYKAEEAISKAMAAASLDLIGLHFHIGSMVTEFPPYLDAMDLVLELAADMKQKYGFDLEEMDIGGGFAVQYTLDSQVPEIGFFADRITERLVERCKALRLPPPSLAVEPGRAIIAQAGVALYRTGTIKEVGGSIFAAIDGGMADNIRPALYGARYEAVSAGKADAKDTEKVNIVGRYCESGDVLIKEATLPPMASGDIVAVPVCGAYCIPMASNYNAALKPAIVMVNSGESRLIRRRESLHDLIRNDIA
jgi:diaminopimelate decarboxylase